MTDTIYVLAGDDDIVVPVTLVLTADDLDYPTTLACEVCTTPLVYGTHLVAPHTHDRDFSGVALCLPCQMAQVATGAGALGLVTECVALTVMADEDGRHAA